MPPTILLLLSLFLLPLTACGPDAAGGGARPENASVVIMGQRENLDEGTVESFPACMGVAVSPTLVLTSDHCAEGQIDGRHIIVDATTWYATARGSQFADTTLVVGETRSLVPRSPLLNWAVPAAVVDGPAEVVVVRGDEIEKLPAEVSGLEISGVMLDHGDSGAGVFQQGRLVGLVQACNSSNDTDCDVPGGRFTRVLYALTWL